MEKKQTAVEWLIEQIPFEWSSSKGAFDAFQIAKQMEKEQIINAYNHNITGFDKLEQEEIGLNWSEDYYNETYGKAQ